MSISTTITYDVPNGFTYDNTMIEVVGAAQLLLNVTYPTTNPTIVTPAILMYSLSAFTPTVMEPGSDTITWTVIVDGVDYYYNGSDWAISNVSLPQTNTAADIAANSVFLDLSAGCSVKFRAFLHSASGATTPTLSELAISYSVLVPSISAINTCLVYGYEQTLLGEAVPNAVVTARAITPFFHTNRRIVGQLVQTLTDSNGYWELSLIETESVEASIQLDIVYPDGSLSKKKSIYTFTVPDQATADYTSLT